MDDKANNFNEGSRDNSNITNEYGQRKKAWSKKKQHIEKKK